MIQFSPAATAEILRLHAKRQNPSPLLRIGIAQQGCLELSYVMEFDPTQQPEDRRFDCNGIPVVIQADHLHYLDNLVIDYSEDMMGGGFRFSNTKALQSCSCGNSFAIAR
jgi:iron-sulfur cluster assembly protein